MNQRDLNQAFQNVTVHEGIPAPCSRGRSSSSDSDAALLVTSTSTNMNPRLTPRQQELQTSPLDFTQSSNASPEYSTEQFPCREIKNSPAQSSDSGSGPLDLSLSHGSDPGYCTDHQQLSENNDLQDLLNGQETLLQPGPIRNISRGGHLSTSSDGTMTSSGTLIECGDIPYFDDSISPLTLEDMQVIPKDFNMSSFDSSSESSVDLNKPPLQNSIGMSLNDMDTIESNLQQVVGMDTTVLCADQGAMQENAGGSCEELPSASVQCLVSCQL